jgi:phage shock protein A
MAGLNNNNSFETFNRMEEKIVQMEAEADAQSEVSEQFSGDGLQQRFKELETRKGADMALDDLKRKMGLTAPAEAAPAVRIDAAPAEAPAASAEEAEIEALLAQAKARRGSA